MDNITKLVTVILIIIIILLSIYTAVKSSMYNKMINELREENKSLISRISSAESYIDMQNYKISEYSKNMKQSEENYNKKIKLLNEKYSALKMQYKDSESLKCNEILKIIDKNQRRYINNE